MNVTDDKRLHLRFIGWFFLINGILFWILGYGYLSRILSSSSLFENSFANYSSLSGKLFIVAFALINYLSYMMLLAFIPALPLFFFAFLLRSRGLIKLLSICFGSLSLILLAIDIGVYSTYKFHINMSIFDLIFAGTWFEVFDFSRKEFETMLLIVLFLCILETIIASFVWNKIVLIGTYRIGKTILLLWFGSFLISYFALLHTISHNNNLLSQQTPNLPFYNQFLAYLIPDKNAADVLYRYSEEHYNQPIFSNDKVHYPLEPMQCNKQEKLPNIIIIMVDSLRFDSLNTKYMPYLSRFAALNWRFQQHVSGGNATQPGLFSLFYSIPGSYWTAMLKQNVPPVLMQILAQNGYDHQILWSSEMVNPPFDKTIYQGLSLLSPYGAPAQDIGNKDRYITDQAINFLAEQKKQKPFFLNLFYDAAHGYCREQSFPTPFQPAINECLRIAMTNEMDPLPYYNRYLNSVHFIDNEIERVLISIAEHGYLDNSIIVITADHGQEFNDNKQNYWGHAGNFTKYQVQVPLIIHWPHQPPRVIDYLTTSYDVAPTLLKRVFHCQNPFLDYSIGQDLLKKEGRLPFVLAGSYSNMGLIETDRLITLRTSGEISITNLQAEPQPVAHPETAMLKEALKLMRLYYSKK